MNIDQSLLHSTRMHVVEEREEAVQVFTVYNGLPDYSPA